MLKSINGTALVSLHHCARAGYGICILFITSHFLSPIEQGALYTMMSLVAIYGFFDVSAGLWLAPIFSRAFLGLSWCEGRITGKQQNFFDLSKGGLIWSGKFAFCFLSLIPIGLIILIQRTETINELEILSVWIFLVVGHSFQIISSFILVMFEGSGRFNESYFWRLVNILITLFISSCILFSGGTLLAIPFGYFISSACVVLLLVSRNKNFFNQLRSVEYDRFFWAKNILSKHFKFSLNTLSGYIIFSLSVTTLYLVSGPIIAGQFAITMTIVNFLSTFSLSQITSYRSKLVKNNAMTIIDNELFLKLERNSIAQFVVMNSLFILLVCLFKESHYVNRLLSFDQLLTIVLGAIVYHWINILSIVMRSNLIEPSPWILLTGAVLLALLTVLYAGKFGASVPAVSFVVVSYFFYLPYFYHQRRRLLQGRY